MAYLSIKNVNKIYPNGFHAVKDFNLEIEEHDFIVILGPSGCGKSTMLRMICGLEETSSGQMILDGKNITDLSPKDRDIAMVFQNYALYPHMSIYDNIGFSLIVRKKNRRIIHQKVRKTQEIVKLTDDQLKRKPGQLSGGQRQRVALGRTIARDAKIYLMDEPLSNLDAKLRGDMRIEIIKLYKDYNQTIVYVSHDQIEAMSMATKIVLMKDGVVEQVGAPKYIYNHPVNLYVATFLGTPQINLIPGRITEGLFENDFFKIYLEKYKSITNEKVILGIRPENITNCSLDSMLEVKLDYVEYLGAKSYGHALLGDTDIVFISKTSKLPDNPKLRMDLDKIIIFDQETTYAIGCDTDE